MMAAAPDASVDPRTGLLGRLAVRNALIGVLRIVVPAVGIVVLLVLVGQIWLSSIARQYGVAGIRIDRGNLVVEKPQYSGTGADGSRYVVNAERASSPLGHSELISMNDPTLDFIRPAQSAFHAIAASAKMNTLTHQVTVPGVTQVQGDDGLTGTLDAVHADMANSVIDAAGTVNLKLADGTTIDAASMHYDQVWTFTHATVVVPSLPRGEEASP